MRDNSGGIRSLRFRITVTGLVGLVLFTGVAHGQLDIDPAEAEQRAERNNERYLQILERRPRLGTAFDRVYTFYVDRGTLDEFVQSLTDRANSHPEDGAGWMILGMMEMRQGHDTAAQKAFARAADCRPDDPIPAWYLGQSRIALGDPVAAAEALEEALRRNPAKTDASQIFQLLGRVYQRAQKSDEALNLWRRYEAAFPDDGRIRAQIALILLEEGELEDAEQRFKDLAASVSDPYKRIQYGVRAAEVQMRLGERDAAVSAFESLLGQLKPDSWLYTDVRRKIEGAWLRTDDYVGLVDYYKAWVEKHPDDVDAMSRLGKYLGWQGQNEAAQQWYRQAIERAPSNTALREALIDQLIRSQDFPQAIEESARLAALDATNPDFIERWGRLYLRNRELDEDERRAEAARVWRKLLESQPDDAVTVNRVADLLRSANSNNEAIRLYQRAIALAPADLQYREYLGEFFHVLKRPAEARAVWDEIATGDRRNTRNLVRVSGIYQNFGYPGRALEILREACELDPEFSDRIRLTELLREQGLHQDALAELEKASTLAAADEEHEVILQEQIQTWLAAGVLNEKIRSLSQQLTSSGTASDWRRLALYHEAVGALADASRASRRAMQLAPESLPVLTVAARLAGQAGLLKDAVEANEKLVKADRRFRTQHLRNIAELERRLGRTDRALQAGQDLVAAAPDNAEHYQFYADLCFALGKQDRGLEVLRRSVRVNPSNVDALNHLARALAAQFRTPEAIELYWRAFEKSESLDDKLRTVQTLTNLYLRSNHFDRLVSRLENRSRELADRRDMTICLANAFQASGDIGMARRTLEELLDTERRDVFLLEEVSRLAEQNQDFAAAAEYQRRINELNPSSAGTVRLANLLLNAGDIDASDALWSGLAQASLPPDEVLQSIDRLIDSKKYEAAKQLAASLLTLNSQDWQALVRLIVIAEREEDDESARKYSTDLLALRLPSTDRGHAQQAAGPQRNSVNKSAANASQYPLQIYHQIVSHLVNRTQGIPGSSYVFPQYIPQGSPARSFGGSFQSLSPQVQQQLIQQMYYGGQSFGYSASGRFSLSDVATFAHGRAIAVAAIMQDAGRRNAVAARLRDFRHTATDSAATDSAHTTQAVWDWYVAQLVAAHLGEEVDSTRLAVTFSRIPDPDAQYAFLSLIMEQSATLRSGRSNTENREQDQNAQVLPEGISHQQLKDAWQSVASRHPQSLIGLRPIVDLIIAGEASVDAQPAEPTGFYAHLIRDDATLQELLLAQQLSIERGDSLTVLANIDRIPDLERQQSSTTSAFVSGLGQTFARLVSMEVPDRNNWDTAAALVNKFLQIRAESCIRDASGTSQKITPSYFHTAQYNVYQNGSPQSTQKTNVLAPTRYWSVQDIGFLVTLHGLYQGGRRVALLNTVAQFRERSTGVAAVVAETALAQLRFLAHQEELAAVHLVRAAALAPDDIGLRINLVRFYQKAGNYRDALALLDTIDAADQTVVKEREQLAMSLSERLGDTARTRQAVQRLFGVRMTGKETLELAKRVKKLKMPEIADALLARVRRTDGNSVDTMASLMKVYDDTGNADVANQIANQILRSTTPAANSATAVPRTRGATRTLGSRSQTAAMGQAARTAAMNVLNKSGQLDELITRVEAQLERAPKSIRLHEILLEYYRAAGKHSAALNVQTNLEALRPRTLATMQRDAGRLMNAERYDEACEIFFQMLDKDPKHFGQNYYQYLSLFAQAKRLEKLTERILKMDLKRLRNNYQILIQTITALMQHATEDKQNVYVGQAMALIERGWTTFPNYRRELLSGLHYQLIWDQPKMCEYVREGIIPQTRQEAFARPWRGVADAGVSMPGGRMTGLITRLSTHLSGAQLDAFTADVQTAVEKFGDSWSGGRLLLAILQAKRGQHDVAMALISETIRQDGIRYVPLETAWVAASELAAIDSRYAAATVDMLATSLRLDPNAQGYVGMYSFGPTPLVADLLHTCGRRREARDVILQAAEFNANGKWRSVADFRLEQYPLIAAHLSSLNFPFLAIRYYREITPELVPQSPQYAHSSRAASNVVQSARGQIANLQNKITPRSIVTWLRDELELLAAAGDTPIEPIDLMITPIARGMHQSELTSIVIESLKSFDLQQPATRMLLTEAFHDLLSEIPIGESSVAVLASLLADRIDDARLQQHAFAALKQHLASAQSAGIPPAAPEIGLWVPARVALQSAETHELGEALLERAQAAAKEHDPNGWLLAILRWRGDFALSVDNKQLAEVAWTELLDAVLADAEQDFDEKPDAPQPQSKPTPTPSSSPKPTTPRASAIDELRERLLTPAKTQSP